VTSERRWMLSLALIGVVFGVALPTGAGCGGRCPDYEADDVEGIYRLIESGERADWMTGSGRMEVTETAIVFSYATMDGSLWEVEYERTETLGD
jgi:hypothetical protein